VLTYLKYAALRFSKINGFLSLEPIFRLSFLKTPILEVLMSAIDFETFVERLTTAAGEAVLPFFRTAIGIENKKGKGGFDPVTAADRAGEAAMRQIIKANFPSHGVIGEEFGSENENAEYVWVLDPIDGTRSFITGLPSWGTLIGLLRQGNPVYGVMSQPFIKERFLGDGASACCRNLQGERLLRTRSCASLDEAVMCSTSPRLFSAEELPAFEALEQVVRLTRFGGDCYSYCMLAAGHVDIVVEAGLAPYDIMPLIPIVEGAGGIVTSWDGGLATLGGRVIAAGDKNLHAKAIEFLQKQIG
jgi:myo-inositol-1(or 4)-monophosphatase